MSQGNGWFKRTFQTVSYMPHFISWVIAANIIITMLSSGGVINNILTGLHIVDEPIQFMQKGHLFWWIIAFSNAWKDMGFNAIMYLVAIAAINPELYEVAKVDGASRLKQIFAYYASLYSSDDYHFGYSRGRRDLECRLRPAVSASEQYGYGILGSHRYVHVQIRLAERDVLLRSLRLVCSNRLWHSCLSSPLTRWPKDGRAVAVLVQNGRGEHVMVKDKKIFSL